MTHFSKNKLIRKWACICTLAWCAACSESSEHEPMPQPEADRITIETDALYFTSEGGEQQLIFSTNHSWQISWNDQGYEWCTTNQTVGSQGNVTLSINVATNPRPESRATTLILTAGTAREEVAVRQEAQAGSPVNADENEEYTDEELDWD